MGKHILVIGSLNMDLSITMGRMPAVGETVMGEELTYNLGGKGANQAYAVGRLGGQVKMLGCVGRDQFGAGQRESLAACGVDVSGLRESEALPTGTAVIYVDAAGSNSIVVVAGANQACDTQYLKENDHLFQWCDYVLMQMEIPMSAIAYAAGRARELGKTVILNPAPAPDLIPAELLSCVDYLTPNETELMKLSGVTGDGMEAVRQGAKALMEQGLGRVVVTLGEEGALLADGDGFRTYPARKAEAVDTTAAGDCFNGAFVVALAEGMSEDEAIRFANAASSMAVTKKGAQSSIPSREELEQILGGAKARQSAGGGR